MQISEHSVLQEIRHTLTPILAATMLGVITGLHGVPFTGQYVFLAVIILLLVARFLYDIDIDSTGRKKYFWTLLIIWIIMRWSGILAALVLIVYAAGLVQFFNRDILLQWAIITPFALVFLQIVVRYLFFRYHTKQGFFDKAIIVGVNELSLKLTKAIQQQESDGIQSLDFFDDRGVSRLPEKILLAGGLKDVHRFVVKEQIKVVYIALSMTEQSRIHFLLDELRDTTVSLYYLPDVFMSDMIQSRLFSIENIPLISLCESPFIGKTARIKRFSDLILSSLILILISPLLMFIALGVKLSSPGPIIFKQLRYGLDGRAIEVYKFRSMTVCENHARITQAIRNDSRITPLGRFLRAKSLDELPQFINVLQGRMSIVGPRPHAVAHNELYRKQIKGYMIRHKVKPGITGWAQINGYRGETDTIEKMETRIEYDLNYLRHWSLSLDLFIIAKTLGIVFKDENAY
ncbi:MAG: undecaprenyl-phosphate glucose phosphotransferase [Methylococcaceae bacterium]|nr:undecaprenyl-phosphate glucose phosphotransferase [Methylococcaceae bacterium]